MKNLNESPIVRRKKGQSNEELASQLAQKAAIGHNVYENKVYAYPFLEVANDSNMSSIHITNGPNFTAPYIMGIGKDNPGTGLMLPNKANGKMISGDQRATVTDPASEWMKVTQQSTAAPLIRLEQNVEGAAAALQLISATATAEQHLLYVGNAQGEVGKIYSSTGALTWLKDIIVHDSNNSGGKLRLMKGIAENTRSHVIGDSTGFDWYNYTGSAGIWYPLSIKAKGNTLTLGAGANSSVVGTATFTDIIKIQNTKLGFFDATPVTKRTGVAVTVEAIHAALVAYGLITA